MEHFPKGIEIDDSFMANSTENCHWTHALIASNVQMVVVYRCNAVQAIEYAFAQVIYRVRPRKSEFH